MKNFSQINHPPIRWDAHGCPPFKIGADLSFLQRYKNSGVNFISLNVGFDLTSQSEALDLINYFHKWIKQHNDQYAFIQNTQQLLECQQENKLGIAFDIEGCNLLNNNIDMITQFYSLGVKQIVFSYNNNNAAGGGCFDEDIGLTSFGRSLVEKCNEVGMVIDCSHVGFKTSMEIMELSEFPIVFSHSNPKALVDHPRNITDKQIIACADKGGVVGINGIGIFLGNNDVRTSKIVEHIDYVVQKVGSEHVGIGLDCIFNPEEIKTFIEENPDTFPAAHGFNDVAVAEPEQFAEIEVLLDLRGYSKDDINNILGENFFRIAKSVWK